MMVATPITAEEHEEMQQIARATCKHENADHLTPDMGTTDSPFSPVLVEQFRCIDCGAWLSLGESSDRRQAVRIEIRAVEIVDRHVNKRGRLGLTGNMVEVDGWCAHLTNVDDHKSKLPAFQAGYLARAIVLHEDPTR